MPLLEGKCLTEQSPAPGAQLSALWRVNDPTEVWENRDIGRTVFSAMAARPEMTESLILDRACASQDTLGWWLCWESRPRQSSLMQDCMHRKVQGKKMPTRSHTGSVLWEYCSPLWAHRSWAECSYQFGNRGLNIQVCPQGVPMLALAVLKLDLVGASRTQPA